MIQRARAPRLAIGLAIAMFLLVPANGAFAAGKVPTASHQAPLAAASCTFYDTGWATWGHSVSVWARYGTNCAQGTVTFYEQTSPGSWYAYATKPFSPWIADTRGTNFIDSNSYGCNGIGLWKMLVKIGGVSRWTGQVYCP